MGKMICILLLLILIPSAVLAWDDCPRGEVDCPSPGECNRYIDTDNDKTCDRSQLAPENRIEETANTQEINNKNLIVNNSQNKMTYHLLPISLFLIFLYLMTYLLSKEKIISVIIHRKIWNILLLISFLISGVLGILLIIKINFGIKNVLPLNVLFWHVEIGIVMFVICVFHIIERRHYFKNLFK